MAGFWSAMAHAVRNAVDHGLEGASERIACGKPAIGTLTLEARESAGELVVEIRDDGRGIDWERLRAKALAAGLPAAAGRHMTRRSGPRTSPLLRERKPPRSRSRPTGRNSSGGGATSPRHR
jgi:hypothetical protein